MMILMFQLSYAKDFDYKSMYNYAKRIISTTSVRIIEFVQEALAVRGFDYSRKYSSYFAARSNS